MRAGASVLLLLISGWMQVSVVLAAGYSDPLLLRQGSWGQAYPDQWGLFAINAYAREESSRSVLPLFAERTLQPVVVAIIDTGVDYRHPELPAERFWRNPLERPDGRDNDGNGLIDDLIGWNFVAGNQRPWDDHGHGTHVAGIIAAQSDNARGISGLAPNVRLMVLKALNSDGYGRGSDIAAAVRYAVDQGAQLIQLSLGGESPGELERKALADARRAGRLVVVAAGNQGAKIAGQGYEALPGVLVVGAVAADQQRAEFSDWGMRLDLVAPGVDILSLRAFGSDFLQRSGEADYQSGEAVVGRDYYRASGNSFAAPFVTGAAAILLGRDPGLGPVELARMMRQSARAMGPPGDDQLYGAGLLDVDAALRQSPSYFLLSRFSHASWQPAEGLVLYGQVDADQFVRARLEYRVEAASAQWRVLPVPVIRQRSIGPVAVIPVTLMPPPGWLTLRLVVEHADGTSRQSLLQLRHLPVK